MKVKIICNETDKECIVERDFTEIGRIVCPKCSGTLDVIGTSSIGPCNVNTEVYLDYECDLCEFSCGGVEAEILSKEELEAMEKL